MFAQFRTMLDSLAAPAPIVGEEAEDSWDIYVETESDRSPAAWRKALDEASSWRPC